MARTITDAAEAATELSERFKRARSAVFARAANLIYVEQAMVMLYFR